MHQPQAPEQLALFTFEAEDSVPISTPRPWSKTYRSWRGDFQVLGHRYIGKSKVRNYDFYVEVYDPDGSWETVLEITSDLTTVAESEFYRIVDRLETTGNLLPVDSVNKSPLLVSESTLITDVPTDTNDSLTFSDRSVTESLVSDASYPHDVSEALSKNDSLTFSHHSVTESLVSDASYPHDVSETLSKNDSLTAINIYKPRGNARGERKYFRYSYKEEGRTKHLHIGGGNIHCVLAQSRMQLVRDALALGQSPQEIKHLIQGFRS